MELKKPERTWAEDWLKSEKKLYINGTWTSASSGKNFTNINPATGEKLAEFQIASQADVDKAVSAGDQCFRSGHWTKMSMREQARKMRAIGEVVRQHHAELATLETLANGKTYKESFFDDIPDCADIFDYYAGWIDKIYGETVPVEDGFLNYTKKEPLGVCAQIVPWNFPLLMACWKIAPALATGNSVVIKPSEHTPYSLIRFFEVVTDQVDLPKGVLNLILGEGSVGSMLTNHMNVHKVAFTGSTDVGKKIVEASANSNLKHVSLELGGKSPVLFFEDTPDLEEAIDRSFTVMFSHKGEKCTEPTRFYFHSSIYEKALDILQKKASAIRCGDPFDDNTDQGPQCYQGHFENVMSYIKSGKDQGARLLVGGEADSAQGKGYYIQPTIFADVKADMKVSQEEIFGPVLIVNKFETDEEAVQLANDSRYGLAAGLYTKDISRAHKVADQIDAGMVFINRYGCYDFTSPFGGFKQSGWGKEMAIHSIDSYTKTKSIWVKL